MMNIAFTLSRQLLFSSLILFASAGSSFAQNTLEAVMTQLREVQENEDATAEELREAVASVQRIVVDFPSSDAAVSILLGEPYMGVSFTSFEQRLQATTEKNNVPQNVDNLVDDKQSCLKAATLDRSNVSLRIAFETDANGNLTDLPEILEPQTLNSTVRLKYLNVVAALEHCAPYKSSRDGVSYQFSMSGEDGISLVPTSLIAPEANVPIGTAETEKMLGLDRQAVRDIQARLLVIGYDPNGIDGSIGRGTRSAIRSWQKSVGATITGFLNSSQLDTLKTQSHDALSQWLQISDNARRYRASARKKSNSLRNGWYRDRNGKYCKRTKIGLIYCTPKRPPDA